MRNMNFTVLSSILAYCYKRHSDDTNLVFGCFDTERNLAYRYNIIQKEKKREEDFNVDLFLLIFDTYGTSILAFAGIVINIHGCCKLLRRYEREKMLNMLLVSLMLFDIIYLTFKLMRSLEPFIPVPNENLPIYYTIADAGSRFSLTSSILMMVAIGRVRYQAIRKPIQQRRLLSSGNKRFRELLKYLIPTVILSLAFALPIFFATNDGQLEAMVKNLVQQLEGDYGQQSPNKSRISSLYTFFVLGLWNVVLLGIFPVVYLIYFTSKMIVLLNKRHIQNARPSLTTRMNETTQKITKSLVAIIMVFVILHSPRVISSLAEFYFLTMPNKNEVMIELGYGVPIWLRFLGPINELCTVLNACVNIIIYRYLNSSGILRYCPTCLPSHFRSTVRPEVLTEVPIARKNRGKHRAEENHQSINLSKNDLEIGNADSVSRAKINCDPVVQQEDDPRGISHTTISAHVVNQTITFLVRDHRCQWI